MKITPPPRKLDARQSANTPLTVINQCGETIYPGILTQSGIGPGTGGFQLTPGSTRSMMVSENWQGRVWGRTNCTFSGNSGSCGSGDCGGVVNCVGTGQIPTTLAEFTLDAGDGHSYYDLSLVDGYNLPVAIVMLPHANSSFQAIPQNLTNPSCVGSVGNLQSINFNPYSSGSGTFLGTTSSDPLPLQKTLSLLDVAQWCPFNLQVSTSTSPSGGVFIYPDTSLSRPYFDPCYSACAKWNLPQDCCTGQYDSPSACHPSQYSQAAKKVCPDAYSYAFDDQTSTFIIPAGAGFEVIFCPGGRSTNIIATSKNKLVQLAQDALISVNGVLSMEYIGNNTPSIRDHSVTESCPIDSSSLQDESDPLPAEEYVQAAITSSLPTGVTISTSTVYALPGSATSYAASEINIINGWQGTGLYGNGTITSMARARRTQTPHWFLQQSLALMGFILWRAW